MKKLLWILVLIVILVGIYIVASKPQSNKLKIGVIAPSTGNFAVLGERMQNGFEMAKADLIKSGTIDDIEIIYEDACQPKEAVAAAQKLVTIDKVNLIGGSFCVVGFVPSIPVFEEANLVYFNTAPNPDSVLGQKYLISTNSSIQEKAAQLAQFAHDKLNAKTAAIIYYNTPLGIDYNKYFTQTFEQAGGKVLSNEVTLVDATDFRTQLTKIKQQQPDVLFVVQLASPLGNLLKQAKELGVSSVVLGNSQNEDPNVLTAAGAAAEGFVISSDEPFPKTEKITDFATRYKELYKQDADVFAANTYDALTLQVMAFKKCSTDSACMLKELHAVKEFPGVSGMITIQENGAASKPTIFKKVENGKFVIIK